MMTDFFLMWWTPFKQKFKVSFVLTTMLSLTRFSNHKHLHVIIQSSLNVWTEIALSQSVSDTTSTKI